MEGIKILKYASPENYYALCQKVEVINPNPNCGGYDGGCFNPNKPRTISANISGRDPSITAAVLVHEVCHLLQLNESRPFDENECYKKDSVVLSEIVQL